MKHQVIHTDKMCIRDRNKNKFNTLYNKIQWFIYVLFMV